MEAWMDGSLMPGVLVPCDELVRRANRDVSAVARRTSDRRVVAVTHDFIIMAFLAPVRGVRITAVPCLGGVFVPYDEIDAWTRGEVRS
jgi:broad specificity phosphatase PhoE